MFALAAMTIILGLGLGFYMDHPFLNFLGGVSSGVGLIFGVIAIVDYRAVRRRERWWKGK